MIRVTFTENDNNLSLRLEGHAGYAEIGNDIVCASATILAGTVAQLVMEADHKGDLESAPEIKLEPGDSLISCKPTEETMDKMKNIYSFAKTGYVVLAYNNPQYVELITVGKDI